MIAGIDEVGRGCLVGAVVAAAVVLGPGRAITGLADSKQLSPRQRAVLAEEIKRRATAWAIGRAEASEVDTLNILQASLLAMKRAYTQLPVDVTWVQVDGGHYPNINCAGETVIKGDQTVAEISAASILAKVARDEEMAVLDILRPGYAFAQHKGYPTRLHKQKLVELGVTEFHRKSYAPIRQALT